VQVEVSMAKWIAKAIKRKGALTRAARRAHAVTKSGRIKSSWLRSAAKKKGTTGKRARLAMTLRKISRRRRR
jgi:hypothetical protein